MLTPEEEEVLKEFEDGLNPDPDNNEENEAPENNEPDPSVDNNEPEDNPEEDPDYVPDNIEPEGSDENEPEGTEDTPEGNEPGEGTEEDPKPSSDESEGNTDFQPVTLKSRNVTMDVKSMDELIKMANLGLDYTKKTQMLSPHRKKVKMIENSGITDEDLVLLKDIKSGNKEALKKLMSDHNFDAFDVDSTDGQYTPTELTQVSDEDIMGEDIVEEIRSDSEGTQKLLEITQNIPDQKFVNVLASNPQNLKTFYEDVKAGVAEEAVSEALRLSTLENIPFGQAYVQSATKIWNARNNSNPNNANNNKPAAEGQGTGNNETPKPQAKKPNAPLSKKMKSGMSGGKQTPSNDGMTSIDDIMNMDDDVFLTKLDGLSLKA